MSAGKFTLFDKAIPKLHKAVYNLPGHTLKLALCEDGQALTASFAGGSGDCRYADLTDETANGDGYTTGGETVTGVAATNVAEVTTVDADDTTWAALTKTGLVYGVLYDFTDADKSLIGFLELNVGGDVDVGGSAFTVQWNSDGLWTATRV